MNYLICWEENHIKKWEMIKEEDNNNFSMNLLRNPDVNKHSIFIVPCTGFMGGIWLWKFTHKNSRVDFWHFYEEYGTEYQKPEEKPENKPILKELHEKNSENTKYGWVCKKNISRDYEEKIFFCAQCGTQLHQRAFTEEEIKQALFDAEMDRYED